MTEPRPDEIVRRIEGAEILAFPRAAAPARDADAAPAGGDTPPPTSPTPDEGGGDGPPGGGAPPDGTDGGEGDDLGDFIARMNDVYGFVLVGQRAMILCEFADSPIEERVRLITVDAFKADLQNRLVRVRRRKRNEDGELVDTYAYLKAAPQWLGARERRSYKGLQFFPNPDGAASAPGYFNLWRGLSVVPDAETPADERWRKYKTFRDHLLTNVCSGDEGLFAWLFAWFAHIVQSPRDRLGTAIVLRGKMGTGKTKVGEYFGALFASHYFLVDDPRYVTGQFNAHMASCLLLQVDEGFWAGDKAAEGRLKGLVTGQKQMIEAKGVDPIPLDNYVRLLFSSNEDWVVPAGMDERRFAVLDVAPHAAQNRAYFGEMDVEMKSGGLEALLADLLAVDLKAENAPKVAVIPKTNALLEQKLRSLDSVSSWWFERLLAGTPTHRGSAWPKHVPIEGLFSDYLRTSDRVGIRRKAEMTSFGMKLRKLMPEGVERVRVTADVEDGDGWAQRRVWCLTMPPLGDCRATFEAALGGQAVEWWRDGQSDAETDGASEASDGPF